MGLNSEAIKKLTESIEKSLVVQDRNLTKTIQANEESVNSIIKGSKFSDDKIQKLLSELSTSAKEGSGYSKRIELLTEKYLNNSNISKEDQKKANQVLNEIKKSDTERAKLQDVQYKKQARDNPFIALKQGFETLKKTGSISEAGGTTLSTFKEGLSFKNITKGLLHTAGVLTDNPALNILATELKNNTEATDAEINRTQDFIESLEDGTPSDEDLEPLKEVLANEREVNDNISNMDLQEIKDILQSSYLDFGSLLEDIKQEQLKQTILFRDILFNAKDSMDDNIQPKDLEEVTTEAKTITPESQKEESSIFDSLGGKGTKGILGSLKGVLTKVALPLVLAKGIFDGFEGFKNASTNLELKDGEVATIGESLSSGIGGILSGLSFGLLDPKSTSQFIEGIGDSISNSLGISGIGSDDETDAVVDSLKDSGALEYSLLGDSQIRDPDALNDLSIGELEALKRFDDFDDSTNSLIDNLIQERNTLETNNNNSDSSIIQEAQLAKNIEQADISSKPIAPLNNNIVQEPIVVQTAPMSSDNKVQKVNQYNIDSNDLVEVMQLHGVRI